tara:strand:- start:259 stop:396 length:138 start_codon:yes stop_codon:yes gene_type:complete
MATEQQTLDEQAHQLLKASVCGDTIGSRYRDMLSVNESGASTGKR